MEVAVEVKLPANWARGQPAQPSHMRTAVTIWGNVQPHMENNLNSIIITASLARTVHLMMLGQPGFEAVERVFII